MKKCKKFFCGLAAFFLALGAGHVASSLSRSGRFGALAEVTDVEPVSELHLDQSKIKKVTAHYETMAGADGNTLTAYVFSGDGNLYDGSTFPEFRFMTEGSNGSTKIAYPSDVKYVHFWYKLDNSNETQMIDVEPVPYLLQVVTSDGQYPNYSFSPINDNRWHPHLMEIRSEDYARFAGVLFELGDLYGTMIVADLRLNQKITQDEPTGQLHLEPEKIKGYTEHHYELMAGPLGNEIDTYVFSAGGNCAKNPEVRFVTEGTQTVNKPYTLVPLEYVSKVTFDYKLSTSSHATVSDGNMEYLLQVLGSDGQYPLHDWQPINDGQWHTWQMDVTKSLDVDGNRDYHDKFAGLVVKMGDINGSLTIANIALKTSPDLVYLDELVTFKTFFQTYFDSERNNATVMLDLNAKVFANSSFDSDSSKETFINDHNSTMKNKEGVATNVQNAIIIGGKTLGEWMDMHVELDELSEARWPISALGDKYRPVTIRVCRNETNGNQWLQIDACLTYISIMDFTVEFDASKFEIYNGETTYKFANNIKFYPTIPNNTDPTSETITYVKQETRQAVTGNFINPDNYVTDYNDGKSIRVVLITNLEANFTGSYSTGYYKNLYAIDHIQYISNAILVNGVKASTFSAYAWRDGLHTVGSEVDAGSPANANFAWPVIVQFVDTNAQNAEDNRIKLIIDINKVALGRYTNSSSFNTLTIADDFTFVNNQGELCKLAEDVVLKYDANMNKVYDAKDEVFFKPTEASFGNYNFPGEGDVPVITLKSTDKMMWGFNISDKAAYQFNEEKVYINGKSIAQLNNQLASLISLEEYKIGDFDIYGLDDAGVPKSSPLTKPIITNAPSAQTPGADGMYVFNIFIHPKVVGALHLSSDGLTVKMAEGFKVLSDTLIPYTLLEETTVVAKQAILSDSAEANLGENDLLRNIGKLNPAGNKSSVKEFDQTADSLVYKQDANGNTGVYFTNSDASTHGEFRVYMPGNAYKAESKGYAMTRLTFDYILSDGGVATSTGRNHSLTPEGEYIPAAGNATNKFTIQALCHNPSNMYFDFDVELINDGNLHTLTLDLAYSDVMGFCFVLWNFCGEFFMSNCVADYLPYDEALNNFVVNTLKMYSVTDNETDWEANVEGALAAYNALTAEEQNLFNTHAAYASARARFNVWKTNKAAADLAAYKVAKCAYIDTAVEQLLPLYRQAEQQQITAGAAQAKQAINAASSIEEIDAIIANLEAALAQLKTAAQYDAEELAAAKTAAKAELEAYKNADDYREAEQQQLAQIVADGKDAIDAANTIDEVNAALASAKQQLDALKTAAEYDAEELVAYKERAVTAITNYYETLLETGNYDDAGKAALREALDAAIAAINAATDKEGVNAAVTAGQIALDAVEEAQQQTSESEEPGESESEVPGESEVPTESEVPGESSEEKPAKKGGCGGSILATSAILTILALAGGAIVLSKKRKED